MSDSLIDSFVGSESGFIFDTRKTKGLEGRYRRSCDIAFILKLDRLMELPTDGQRKIGLKKLIKEQV
jgi:hypothetical protein